MLVRFGAPRLRREVSRIPQEWDRFYWKRVAPSHWGLARDRDFLKWRYEDNPLLRYRCLLADDHGSPVGLLVFRDELSQDGRLKIARVMEWLGTPGGRAAVLDGFLNGARGEGFALIDLFGTGAIDWDLASSRGFVSVSGKKEYTLPHLFQPLSVRMKTMSCCWHAAPRAGRSLTGKTLYLTKGDGDCDRPVSTRG